MITLDDFAEIPLGRILAIDFGQKRIGLAVSDPTQILATPLVTIQPKGKKVAYAEIARIVDEYQVVGIVVGNPLHLNGTSGEKAQQVAAFAETLATHVKVPILLWDERWTTISAQKSLWDRGKSPSRNRDQIDQIAAAFLLQSFLNRLTMYRRSHESGTNHET